MKWQILIAHAKGEEKLAEQLAEPLREAGYGVTHEGTVMVGDSIVGETEKALSSGQPLVLCGTVRAVGSKWARKLVNAAHTRGSGPVFVVQMEEDADVESIALGGKVALYYQDPVKAMQALIDSLNKYYPPDADSDEAPRQYTAEQRYRELALESCDIIDLANLPENDRHVAARKLDMRRLYVPLRVRVEAASGAEAGETELEAIEKRRAAVRRGADGGAEGERVSVGERLTKARRLVVLGDPGAGKTTLTRWLATAYLLRLRQSPDWQDLPDVATLPDEDLLPIIIRCRELDRSATGGALEDVLRHTLRKAEMSDAEALALQAVLRDKLKRGQALLLLDGLDEITDPSARARFCQQLENIHIAYPDALIVATSRVVGYREMGYRIGRGFEHVTVADLSTEDKDEFARRWCELVELPERHETAATELIHDMHSSDRIERLTGNPMLLTTMALVKRKIGRLPSRRADLYANALQVLLNWRSDVDQPLDDREAVPQLEYVAYEMCRRGVQQLRRDEILELFERMRDEYPRVHAARNHTPEEFLRLLERRTGLLVEAGYERHLGRLVPVYEFRHLTFQEYLAALALVDSRFPGRPENSTLAENVAPLSAQLSEETSGYEETELAVTESWRETLRLCIVSCRDEDVDSVLLAILNPLEDEDAQLSARPRAIQAALCLADEPNASEDVARSVLRTFVAQITKNDGQAIFNSVFGVDVAVRELSESQWAEALRSMLVERFCGEVATLCWNIGHLFAASAIISAPSEGQALEDWLKGLVSQLTSDRETAAVEAALAIWHMRGSPIYHVLPGMIDGLLKMLEASAPAAYAAGQALNTLNNPFLAGDIWRPERSELDRIISYLARVSPGRKEIAYLIEILGNERDVQAVELLLSKLDDKSLAVRRSAARSLGNIGDARAVEPLIRKLTDEDNDLRRGIAYALGQIGDARAVEPLIQMLRGADLGAAARALGRLGGSRAVEELLCTLTDENADVRRTVFMGLAKTCEDEIDRILLSRDFDALDPFLDVQEKIDEARIVAAIRNLGITADEVRRRYEALAERFPLKLAWRAG
jgi:hypothetical protein